MSFYEVLSAAIKDLSEHGYDSAERVAMWIERIRIAARDSLVSEVVLEQKLRQHLAQVFDRTVNSGRLLKVHPGVSQYTLAAIKPKLRRELDRRILANASLIKLNRDKAIAETVQRFAGWATSIPIGGSDITNRKEENQKVRRGMAGLSYVERRCLTDQSHKLVASINDIVAKDGGAIAMKWHHVAEGPPAYQSRPEHVARNGKIYAIRDSWAMQKGFMKLGGHSYLDEITQPGEEVSCRCSGIYLYTVSQLPSDMITVKGKEAQLAARKTIAAFA